MRIGPARPRVNQGYRAGCTNSTYPCFSRNLKYPTKSKFCAPISRAVRRITSARFLVPSHQFSADTRILRREHQSVRKIVGAIADADGERSSIPGTPLSASGVARFDQCLQGSRGRNHNRLRGHHEARNRKQALMNPDYDAPERRVSRVSKIEQPQRLYGC